MFHTPRRRRTSFATLTSLLALLGAAALGGCATRDEPDPAAQDKRPERIVSLSPSATETLFAVGAGQQVVAVDSASTFPEQAPRTTLSGLTPDPEAIASHKPDLVIVSSDVTNLTAALEKTGTKTLVLPDAKTLDAAYAQFARLGEVTGHKAEGEDLARRTKADIDKLVADTPKPAKPLSYYHELDQTYYSVTSATFLGSLYQRFGLTNIADGADPTASGGYPQLSAEKIIQADPALIFLADTKCCGQNAQTVAARPGWNTLTAVKSSHVFPLDDDIASRWSPRITDLARAISAAVATP
ncbi:ABC transporter substrate-binding protein [Amycolatopsis sp.]|jgi:iron complex transport system substrate-binding protein|uniref:ABC transporter substrate-binding protein n=1 Tax=Amycolatopsis sp. TaxID=37632 RepID=UPI002DFE04E3|nr:ABC transporter substrate-binding protein [Amycolatopsis sp.]